MTQTSDHDPVNKQTGWEEIDCILCGEKASSSLVWHDKERGDMVRCLTCGLVFRTPRRLDQFVGQFFAEKFTESRDPFLSHTLSRKKSQENSPVGAGSPSCPGVHSGYRLKLRHPPGIVSRVLGAGGHRAIRERLPGGQGTSSPRPKLFTASWGMRHFPMHHSMSSPWSIRSTFFLTCFKI